MNANRDHQWPRDSVARNPLGASNIPAQSARRVMECRHHTSRFRRRGLTLFEVLLALVIFAGAFTAIGQLISSGVRGALRSRFQLQAVQMCQAKMGEVVCGAQALKSMQADYPDDPAWSWNLLVGAAPVQGLMKVEVTVQRTSLNKPTEIKYSITRYVRDPQLYIAAQEEAEQNAQDQEASSTAQ